MVYHIDYIDKTGSMQRLAGKIAEKNNVQVDIGEFVVSFFGNRESIEKIREGLSEWPVAFSGYWTLD